MQLELATPTRQLVSSEVDEVVAPGPRGTSACCRATRPSSRRSQLGN